MAKTEKIYMPLLDEGTPVWRPIMAERLDKERFLIVSKNSSPDDEKWEFNTGDTVRCETKEFVEGDRKFFGLIAIEKISRPE